MRICLSVTKAHEMRCKSFHGKPGASRRTLQMSKASGTRWNQNGGLFRIGVALSEGSDPRTRQLLKPYIPESSDTLSGNATSSQWIQKRDVYSAGENCGRKQTPWRVWPKFLVSRRFIRYGMRNGSRWPASGSWLSSNDAISLRYWL